MLHQAINILKEQTGIETIETDWGFESVTAEREELDPAIIQLSKITSISYDTFVRIRGSEIRQGLRGVLLDGYSQ